MVSGHQNKSLIGGLYMAFAMFVFMSVNVAVKDATASYPLMQVVFFRYAFSIIPCLVLLKAAGGLKALKTVDIKWHFFSGCIGVLGLYCLFKSFHVLPLADATAFSYSSILFVTLLSSPILNEKVGPRRWIAVLIGFSGVIFMVNPTGRVFQTGALYSLTFALIDATVIIMARLLTKRNHPASIVFYFVTISAFISAFFLPFGNWETPFSLLHWGQLILLGIGGGIGQILLTHAFRYAPATVAAPVSYTSFVWGVLFGILFWNDFPTPEVWIGCSVLIVCGVYITYRAHKIEKAKALKG